MAKTKKRTRKKRDGMGRFVRKAGRRKRRKSTKKRRRKRGGRKKRSNNMKSAILQLMKCGTKSK